MIDPWFESVRADVPPTQGDLIADCPLLRSNWSEEMDPDQFLASSVPVVTFRNDVIVMTQACDLEHHKVSSVVLGPIRLLSAFRQVWELQLLTKGQNPSGKAWKSMCKDLADGLVWNQSLLNKSNLDGFDDEPRIVDFTQIPTAPRSFLEGLLVKRGVPRLRLRSPYREHLSQAFARFFMRVGLPTPVEGDW